jgi:low affinity Fe/Cu permease
LRKKRAGFVIFDPFILTVVFLLSVVLIGILWLIFAKIFVAWEKMQLEQQMVTDIDYELQVLLYSNCNTSQADNDYKLDYKLTDNYNLAEIIALKMSEIKRGDDTKENVEKRVVTCLSNTGGIEIAAASNDKIIRFYVIDEGETYFEGYARAGKVMIGPSIEGLWSSISEEFNFLTNWGSRFIVEKGGVVGATLIGAKFGGLRGAATGGSATYFLTDLGDVHRLFSNEQASLIERAMIKIPIDNGESVTAYLEKWRDYADTNV